MAVCHGRLMFLLSQANGVISVPRNSIDLALEQKLEAISRLRQALDSVGFLECESVDSLFAWRFLDDVYPISGGSSLFLYEGRGLTLAELIRLVLQGEEGPFYVCDVRMVLL